MFEFFGVFQLDLLFSGENLVVLGTFWQVQGFPALFSVGLVVSGVFLAGYWHCFDWYWLVLFLSAGFSCVSADTGQFRLVQTFFGQFCYFFGWFSLVFSWFDYISSGSALFLDGLIIFCEVWLPFSAGIVQFGDISACSAWFTAVLCCFWLVFLVFQLI